MQHPFRPEPRHPRSLLRRALTGVAAAVGGFLALASAVVLHGETLLPVVVLAVLAAAVAASSLERDRAAAALLAAGATVAVVLVVTGIAVLAGVRAAVLVGGAAVVVSVAAGLWHGRHGRRPDGSGSPTRTGKQGIAPVSLLSTSALTREWRWTTAALVTGLDPVTRQRVVRRRGDVLDELERREPRAFGRWLAAAEDADPAAFFGRRWSTGSDAA